MSVAIVMPVGPGREKNVTAALTALYAQTRKADVIVIVEDGVLLQPEVFPSSDTQQVLQYSMPSKHQPGMEQPRNIGARVAKRYMDYVASDDPVSHVWFVDSDIIMEPTALEELMTALELGDTKRIIVAPYEWLSGRKKRPDTEAGPEQFFIKSRRIHNDPRWEMFNVSPPEHVYYKDLSAGLACFSGNLLWNLSEFERVGGFWSEIHHGRCEDGELGLRAVAMDVPISFCGRARGYHLEHPVNTLLALERNTRDVPMLNARHPWVESANVFLVDRDGKAFDVKCDCGDMVPTIAWWNHARSCRDTKGMELLAHV